MRFATITPNGRLKKWIRVPENSTVDLGHGSDGDYFFGFYTLEVDWQNPPKVEVGRRFLQGSYRTERVARIRRLVLNAEDSNDDEVLVFFQGHYFRSTTFVRQGKPIELLVIKSDEDLDSWKYAFMILRPDDAVEVQNETGTYVIECNSNATLTVTAQQPQQLSKWFPQTSASH